MLNYSASMKHRLLSFAPIPLTTADDGNLMLRLELGLTDPMWSDAERRAVLLIVAAELMTFLGDDCVWVTRLELSRTAIQLEHAVQDPDRAYQRLVGFCLHWQEVRADLA